MASNLGTTAFPSYPVLGASVVSLGSGFDTVFHTSVPQVLRKDDAKVKIQNSVHTDFRFVMQEDRFSAVDQLDVRAELKLSVLCGLVSVSGSGEYLKANSKGKTTRGFTIVVKTTSRVESLGYDSGSDWDTDLLADLVNNGDLTHVVGQVTYGANATISASFEVEESDDMSKVKGSLGVTCEWLAASISGRGAVDVSESAKQLQSRLKVTIKSDTPLSDVPTDLDQAVVTLKTLIPLLSAEENQRVIEFQLYPATYILRKEDAIRVEISGAAVEKCVERMREIDEQIQRVRSTKAAFAAVAGKFPLLAQRLDKLMQVLRDEEAHVADAVQSTLKALRTHSSSADAVSAVLRACRETMFPCGWSAAVRAVTVHERECQVFQHIFEELAQCSALMTIFEPKGVVPVRIRHADPEAGRGNAADPDLGPIQRLTLVIGKQLYSSTHPFLDADSRVDYDETYDEWVFACDEGDDPPDELPVFGTVEQFIKFVRANAKDFPAVQYSAVVDKNKDVQCELYHFKAPGAAKGDVFRIPDASVAPAAVSASMNGMQPEVHVTVPPAAAGLRSVMSFEVRLESTADNFTIADVPPNGQATFTTVAAEAMFGVRVRGVTACGRGDWSAHKQVVTPAAPGACCHIAAKLNPSPVRIVEGKPPFFQLDLETTHRIDSPATATMAKRSVTWKRVKGPKGFPSVANAEDLVILLIGATGAGKSTAMNTLVNYMLGVREDCEHRYVLVPDPQQAKAQHTSVTSDVTVYTIPCFHGSRVRRTVHLIDPPGQNDTRGPLYGSDWLLDMFHTLYERQPFLHCVAFLTISGNVRMTPEQRYVTGEATKVFGRSIKQNFVVIFTKNDGGRPLTDGIIDELKKTNIELPNPPTSRIVVTHNVACAMIDSDLPSAPEYFRIAEAGAKKVFDIAMTLEASTTAESQEVVKRRRDINEALVGMQTRLNHQLNLNASLLEDFKIIKGADPKVPQKIEKRKEESYNVDIGHVTTLCKKCWMSCHPVCNLPAGSTKEGCAVMSAHHCTVCPGKCHFSDHSNDKFIVKYRSVVEWVDDDKLLAAYAGDVAVHSQKEAGVRRMLEDYINALDAVVDLIKRMHHAHSELTKIALNPVVLTPDEYLEQMIAHLELEKAPGFRQKVEQLRSLLQQQRYLKNVELGLGDATELGDPVAHLRDYLSVAVYELGKMTELEAKDYEAVRTKEVQYLWCDAPCTWAEALAKMMSLLETVLQATNGVDDGQRVSKGKKGGKGKKGEPEKSFSCVVS